MIHKPTQKKRSGRSNVTTRSAPSVLTTAEEQVVRMRHGFGVPADMELPTKAGGNAAVAAELEAIERRALAAAGTRQNAKKSKIVSALRHKS